MDAQQTLRLNKKQRLRSKRSLQLTVSTKVKAVFFTILAGILWGTSFPVIKIGLTYVDSFAFVFWRFLVSSSVLLAIMLATRKFSFKITEGKLLLFLGAINGLSYVLQYIGMNYAPAANAALFINLSAMWVALLSPKLLGEHMSSKKVLGVLFGVLGVVLISTNLNFAVLGQGQFAGDILLIASGFGWAVFMVYHKRLERKNSSSTSQSMTWVLLFTTISILPFSLFSGPKLIALPLTAWAAIFYTATVCWVIPYYLWLEGLKHLSASTSTVLLLSEVMIAVILSVVVLNEAMTIFSAVGALFIMLAIILVSLRKES